MKIYKEKKSEAKPLNMKKEDMEALAFVIKRQKEMQEERWKHESDRRKWEKAMKATVPNSPDGKAQVNIPLEQVLRETYVWTLENLQAQVSKNTGKIESDYQQIYEIVFDHFMDREKVRQERFKFENAKWEYWTGVLYSGVWFETKHIYDGKGKDFYNKKASTKKYEIRHIGVKNTDIRRAWFDNNAESYDECNDCILEEKITREEYSVKYLNNKNFRYTNTVSTVSDNENKELHTKNEVVLIWNYWNKMDGSYIIVVNKKATIYNWTYTCKHGMLPLIPVQHYYRRGSVYGIGWPERLATVRPYLNSILKVTLDSAWLNASPALLWDDNIEVDWDLYLEAWSLSELKMTWDATRLQQFQTNINVGQLVEILKLMEDYWIVTTGINFKAPYTSSSITAFEKGAMMEEQNQRAKPVLQLDYEWRDAALTIMLVNVIDFAPYALAEHLMWEDDDEDFEWYTINVEDKRIEMKGGKMTIQDDVGYIENLQLKPELFVHWTWLRIKITTPYTTTILPSLKKAEMQEYLQGKAALAQMFGTAEFMWDPKELNDKYDEVYGMESDNLNVKTRADKNKEKFAQTKEIVAQTQASFSPMQSNVLPSQPWGLQETPAPQWGQ